MFFGWVIQSFTNIFALWLWHPKISSQILQIQNEENWLKWSTYVKLVPGSHIFQFQIYHHPGFQALGLSAPLVIDNGPMTTDRWHSKTLHRVLDDINTFYIILRIYTCYIHNYIYTRIRIYIYIKMIFWLERCLLNKRQTLEIQRKKHWNGCQFACQMRTHRYNTVGFWSWFLMSQVPLHFCQFWNPSMAPAPAIQKLMPLDLGDFLPWLHNEVLGSTTTLHLVELVATKLNRWKVPGFWKINWISQMLGT